MRPEAIRIKPHHFIDIVTDLGRGQREFRPHPLGHALHTVARRVLEERDVLLEMDLGADDIGRPCRQNQEGLCRDTIDTSFRPLAPASKREWNLRLDERWCRRLGLRQGERLTTVEFCRRVRDLAGDIADIYREEPCEQWARRAAGLREGLRLFLAPERG